MVQSIYFLSATILAEKVKVTMFLLKSRQINCCITNCCIVCTYSNAILLYYEVYGFYIYRHQVTQIQDSFQASTLQFQQALDQIEWNPETVQDLQQAVLNGPQVTFCTTNNSVSTCYVNRSLNISRFTFKLYYRLHEIHPNE